MAELQVVESTLIINYCSVVESVNALPFYPIDELNSCAYLQTAFRRLLWEFCRKLWIETTGRIQKFGFEGGHCFISHSAWRRPYLMDWCMLLQLLKGKKTDETRLFIRVFLIVFQHFCTRRNGKIPRGVVWGCTACSLYEEKELGYHQCDGKIYVHNDTIYGQQSLN